MRSFWISTFSRADSLLALAASVAAQFLPKSNRSWLAVTVAWVDRATVASVTFCPVLWMVTVLTVFCWKPFQRPLIWGSRGDSAWATRCWAARYAAARVWIVGW